MSMFLPEGFGEQTPSGVAVTPSSPAVSDGDAALMQRVFGAAGAKPNMIPDGFMAYLVDFIQTSNLTIPIGQVFGSALKFNQTITTSVNDALAAMFKANTASSEGEVNITSSSLATFTGAPSIGTLDDGHYVVFFGTSGNGDAAGTGAALTLAVSANGASNTNVAETQAQALHLSIARADVVTLNAGDGLNSLALLAATSIAGHTSVVRHSWIMCLKYADLGGGASTSTGAGGGYGTVQDEGSALAARAILDFAGAGVTATDDAANGRTLITIPGGGAPSGSAGGDLSGTYPNPTVAALAITDAKVAAANKDGLAATASMRTLGTGAAQAAAGNDSRLSDSRAPSGSAGGDLTGTYPNPTLGANKVTEAKIGLSDVTTDNVTSSQHGFAPKSAADATKFLNSDTTPTYAQVKDSDLSTSDITTNNVSTSKHGFAPKAPNDATKFLNGTGAYTTPAGGGIGSVLYDYVVTGSDKAMIDTFVDDGGAGVGALLPTTFRVLKVSIYARTDEAAIRSGCKITLNNDGSSIYDQTNLTGLNTTASAGTSLGLAAWQPNCAGANAAANYFSTFALEVPNYAGTVGYKTGAATAALNDTTAANDYMQTWAMTYRNTAAITRLALSIATAGQKFKVGTRFTILAF